METNPTIQAHIGNFLTRSSDLHSAVAEVLTRTNPREIKDEMEARLDFRQDLLHLHNGIKDKIVELESLNRKVKEAMMQQRVDTEKLQSQAIELYSARKRMNA